MAKAFPKLTRRLFLGACVAMGSSALLVGKTGPQVRSVPPRSMRGKVVSVHDSRMAVLHGEEKKQLLYGWLTKALESLTGEGGKRAWGALFSPQDRVAIKVNAMGGPRIAVHPELAAALVQGIMEAGVAGRNILIWDRTTRELQQAGYVIREDGDGPLCMGTDRWGYEPAPMVHGSIGSCFSRILTRWATVLVNVSVLKDHDLSGVSLSMKNLFGVIHNPNKYHDRGCAPYLVDLLDHPQVRGKLRLAVCDGARAQCHGGPSYSPRWVWPLGKLLVSADPVALDRIGESLIAARRRELGLPSLEEEGRGPSHILMATHRGLGQGLLDAIEVRHLEA